MEFWFWFLEFCPASLAGYENRQDRVKMCQNVSKSDFFSFDLWFSKVQRKCFLYTVYKKKIITDQPISDLVWLTETGIVIRKIRNLQKRIIAVYKFLIGDCAVLMIRIYRIWKTYNFSEYRIMPYIYRILCYIIY